jgi:hypothetical protein
MRSRALLAWLLLGAVCFAGADGALRFTWALVYKSGSQGAQAIDYAARVVRLASGDRFRIHFQPRSRCFLYVYLHDAQKNLYLLGQRDFDPQENPETNRGFTLPEGENWYHLDDSGGAETFYLIASDQRLRRLEALTSRAQQRPGKPADLLRLARKRPVLDEIRKLIREASDLAEPVQMPVTVAGEFRGITEESEYQGIDVQAGSLYVRTIRLEH